jgi:hypothetical protein
LSARFSLVVYLAAALLNPELHRRRHGRFGADHVHNALGAIEPAPAARDELSIADHHAAFDEILQALDLADVAHAGVLAVDCSLAAYTGVDCSTVRGDHPHSFGDQLLARHAHRRPIDTDPRHGAGSLEHLGASAIASRVFVLAPPERPRMRVIDARAPIAPSLERHFPHDCRGPPALV